MPENIYKFNSNHLHRLLEDTITLFLEYRDKHDKTEEEAQNHAILDMLDGLAAEKELFEMGEVQKPNQILEKVGRKKKWHSAQEKNKFYNDKRRDKLNSAKKEI